VAQCRICKKYETGRRALIKYSVRHYAHPKCALDKWGAEFFQRLTPWQCRAFPLMVAKRAGLLEELEYRAGQEQRA